MNQIVPVTAPDPTVEGFINWVYAPPTLSAPPDRVVIFASARHRSFSPLRLTLRLEGSAGAEPRRLRRIKIDLVTTAIRKKHPTHGTGRRSAIVRRLIAADAKGLRAGRTIGGISRSAA